VLGRGEDDGPFSPSACTQRSVVWPSAGSRSPGRSSITATEFGGGRFTIGASPRPGMVAHSPDYAAGFVLRLLRTGKESCGIPHGPEQPGLAQGSA
jgi:hypothetical protein